MKIRLMHPAVGEIAFPLKPGGSLVVGRLGSMTDVEISWDPRISRRHCRLWEKDGRVWFQDLESRNGSWIGNERVAGVVRLAPGSSVLIGETILLLPDGRSESEDEVEATHERPLSEAEAAALAAAQAPAPSPVSPPPRLPTPAPQPAPMPRLPTPQPRAPTLPPVAARAPSGVATPVEPTGATADLQHTRDAPPAPEPRRVTRNQPRFVNSTRVRVRARDRDDLRELWMRDISKGGLFVETRMPPPSGTTLEVELETPAGRVVLKGTVVHVLTEEMATTFGGDPGVGVQFSDLDPRTRDAIQAYVEGLAEELHGGSNDVARLSTDIGENLLQSARKFLRATERADFYAALDVTSTAGKERVHEAAQKLQDQWTEGLERMAPPQVARLKSALSVLSRVRRILTHDEGRLEYDFRHGHVRAKERIQVANSGSGPSLSVLRRTWNQVFPDRVDRAALLTRKAFAARQRQDLAAAIDAGRAALDLNPFFEELRQTVEVWETTIERKQ